MTKPFFFVINVEPTPAATGADVVKAAIATVCVIASSREEAKTRALSYLIDYAWIAKEMKESFLCDTPERLAQLQTPEASLYRKALRDGIAAFFEGWRKNKIPDCDLEIRSMGSPMIAKGKH